MIQDSVTYQELISQSKALAAGLKAVQAQADGLAKLWQRGYDRVLFTGCGSTYYLSLSAAYALQKLTALFCVGIPGGEFTLSPHLSAPLAHGGKTLLVAVSRSGTTTETVRAVEQFIEKGAGDVLTVSCEPNGPLGELGEINISIPEAREDSIVQTRAFVAMQMALLAMASVCTKQTLLLEQLGRVPELVQALLDAQKGPMIKLSEMLSLDRIYFLGSGMCYGLACEASLKMKEMSLTHTEPFHFLEFRHGPKSMLTENTLVVGLHSLRSQNIESHVLMEARNYGARIFSLAEKDPSILTDYKIVFDSGLDPLVHSLLYLPPLQLLALARADTKGLNPDSPHNLDAVVKLDTLTSHPR